MKLLLINEVCGTGSTGKICAGIAEEYESKGYICKIAYGRDGNVPNQYKKYAVRIGSDFGVKLHALSTRLFDNSGFCSSFATKRFIKWADKFDPDILWLHNIHGYYINVEMLFKWIKSRPNMKVKWTLHDCWAFTGHCVHFSAVKCMQWKKQCNTCVMTSDYPKSLFFSNCKRNFIRKKEAFTGVKGLTIYTPSNWLKNLVKQSFLKKYEIQVMPNEIDKSVFKRVNSSFRIKNGIENKTIILGVANIWDERKGFSLFIRLAHILGNKYKVVMVGLNKKQLRVIPKNVLGIEHTEDVKELVEIYSCSDLFLNLSVEETFGMTTVEAISCGCKAIVMKGSACEEIVVPLGGLAVERDIDSIIQAIKLFRRSK